MARDVTLASLLIQLRAEARLSQSSANNNQVRDTQVLYLQRTQQWLWDDYDWPHLRVERYFDLQNGQRFYDPTNTFDVNGTSKDDMTIDRIEHVDLRYGDTWIRLNPYISEAQYNEWSSDLDERSWPVLNWRIYENEMLELWPIPSQDANIVPGSSLEGRVKITGIRKLRPLVDDTDRCDLDDKLLALFAAAELTSDADIARYKLDMAGKRLAKLRGELVKVRTFGMFSGPNQYMTRRPRRMSAIYIAPTTPSGS